MSRRGLALIVDPIASDRRRVGAEIHPERIELGPCGDSTVAGELAPARHGHASRAVRSCPQPAPHLVERAC
jgi:hypothetical protein